MNMTRRKAMQWIAGVVSAVYGSSALGQAGGPVAFSRDGSGLVVNLPQTKPNPYAYSLKIV